MNTKGQAYTHMLAKLFEVKDTGGKGKGLFAKEMVLKGTVISFGCKPGRRILKDEFESIPIKEKSFIFKYGYRKADGSPIFFHAMKSFT